MTLLVPATDLAPSLPSRRVTINLAAITEGPLGDLAPTVTFRLYGDIHVGVDRVIVASLPAPLIVDLSSGSGEVRLPVFDGRFGGSWAIVVKKSWAPHEYLIRVPAGGGPIDLSEIAPLATLDPAGGPGGQIGTGGLPPGGVQGDVLVVTAEGLKWAKLADLYDGERFGHWAPGARTTLVDTSRYEAFPVACQMTDGRIVLAWQSLENHYGGPSSVGKVRISSNDGTSWSTAYTIKEPATSPAQTWVPVGVATHGGTVAMLLYTNSASGRQGWITTSTNPTAAGNWTPLVRVAWPSNDWNFACSLAWVDNGTPNGLLIAAAYGSLGIALSVSADKGATWTPRGPQISGYTESAVTQVGTQLVMLARDDNTHAIVSMISDDWGVTWSTPRLAAANAEGLPHVTQMPDGTLLATIRDLNGLGYQSWSLIHSRDNGTSWSKVQVDDSWMMYGQVVPLKSGVVLLFGASMVRGSSTNCDVWQRKLTLTPSRVVDAASLDQLRDALTARATYTPTWYTGTAITLGNGSTTGAYRVLGDQVTVELTLNIGSTTAVTAGSNVQVTLPVGALSSASGAVLSAKGSSNIAALSMISARFATATIVTLTKPTGNLTGADLGYGTTIQLEITYRKA